jgi:ABC-type branched-subunit amino acid transport system ATPase component
MKIKTLHTKDGDTINLGKFTVLVGPNNVGKSQTLRDIQAKMNDGATARTTLITELKLEKPASFDKILEGLEVVEDRQNLGLHNIRGIRSNLQSGDQTQVSLENLRTQFDASIDLAFMLGNLAKYRVSFLDASSRLAVARTVPSFNPSEGPPTNLLQGLFANDESIETELRNAFKNAFGMDIKLDYSGMQELTFRVAQEFGVIPDDPRKAFPIMREYNQLDVQGDGFRSFVGVVLSSLLSKDRIILLDEPEAFLHPAQARVLGSWVATHSETTDSQIIIATHNANFLAGILNRKSDADIFRLNRSADRTSYNRVPADATERLVKSPILSSQRVMEAFFYKGVAVCEADSDRVIYQTVAGKEFGNENILFVHAHNKQTIKQVVSLLRDATIPVCAISDIDILNSEDTLLGLLAALSPSGEFSSISNKRQQVANLVSARDEAEVLAEIKAHASEFLEQLKAGSHNLSGARGALDRIYKDTTKWSLLKKQGLEGLPEAEREMAQGLLNELKAIGLFVVPVGELEGWLNVGTIQKNKWMVLALAALGEGKCSVALREFVKEILQSMGEEVVAESPADNDEAVPIVLL